MKENFQNFATDVSGVTSIEYALLIATIGACVVFCGSQVADAFDAAVAPMYRREM